MSDTSLDISPLQCIVVTPERTALETGADFVVLPLDDGEFGVAPGHSPVIARLGYGELRVRRGGERLRYYVDGGFAQVAGNVVSVLTGRAMPADQVDVATAEEQLRSALGRTASGDEQLAIRDRLLAQARSQLRVATGRA
jgi:F-type H+-transporting ATPase subunit epsilon